MIGFNRAFLAWVKYLVPDKLERDPRFRHYLGRLSRIGMIVAGILAGVGVGLLLLIKVAFQGKQLIWVYDLGIASSDFVILWDKLLIIGLGILGLFLSRTKLDVEVGRYIVWAMLLAGAFITVFDDVLTGDVNSSAGYLVLVLFLGVSAIPFRPWQVTMIGVSFMLIYVFEVKVYPGGMGVVDEFFPHMIPTTVLATVLTCYLYQARHRLYQARQKEILMRNSISQYAEDLEQINVKLRDTQASLVQSEKMAALGNLVAGVAHEINSPLGSIGSSADTIKRALRVIESALYDGEAASQDERVNKAFQTLVTLNESVSGGVERIDRIVTALRNFARLDEGEYQSFDVNGGIEDTLTLVLANPEVRVEVEKDLGPLPELYCRPRELNQVFINILNNALEATESRGRITIKTREDDDRIRIQITDNGSGIPPERLALVFEPGYTTKGRGVGTGLGLAISYRIIEDHGGTISIESQPGEGTTVFLALPIKSCQSSSGSEPRA
ncbi:MAG: ATP-binding protein [Candidatus Aminicenantaceae bacterium]